MEHTIASLEARVARLERTSRRWRVLAFGLGGTLAIALTTAQTGTAPTVIGDAGGAHIALSAAGVATFDAAGKRRAFFGILSDGSAGMFAYDADGNKRLDGSIDTKGIAGYGVLASTGKYVFEANDGSHGGFVRTSTNAGVERAYAGTYSDGTGGFSLYDDSGTERAHLTLGTNGIPGLGIFAANGKVVVEANAGASGGFVRTSATDGTERSYIGTYTDGTGGMSIYGSRGKAVVEANSGTTGGFLRASDPDGTPRGFLGLYTDANSGVAVYGSNGKVSWSTP